MEGRTREPEAASTPTPPAIVPNIYQDYNRDDQSRWYW